MVLMVKVVAPVSLSITILGALVVPIDRVEKVRAVGDKRALAPEITAVSLNATDRGLLTASRQTSDTTS